MTARPIYSIRTIAPGAPHAGETFVLACDRPEGAPSPETRGQVVWLPDEGLEVSMWCREANPRAVYVHPNDPVHTDSCMEAFLDCFPDLPQRRYVALEMNANGASHCSIGAGRHGRTFALDLGLPHPEVLVERFTLGGALWWRATCLLRKSLLEGLYGRDCAFLPGQALRGNFYKCGDCTESPHWGSWAPIARVDFHAPDTFGDLVIAGVRESGESRSI